MTWPHIRRAASPLLALLVLAGCQYLPRMPGTADVEIPGEQALPRSLPFAGGAAEASSNASRPPLPAGRRSIGVDPPTAPVSPAGTERQPLRRGPGGIEISLADAEVRDVARLLLGDILGRSFTVAEDVRGRISVQTARGIDASEVLALFDGLLSSIGATAIDSGNVVQIIRRQNARAVGSPISGPGGAGRPGIGFVTEILPLRFIAAAEFRRLIEPLVREALVLSIDETRNILVVSGPTREIETVREAARTFDQDWLGGRSVALVPLRNARPADVVRGLGTLFGIEDGASANAVIRFRPIERLNAVLIVANRPEMLRRAESWAATFDQTVEGDEPRMFVYPVQARRAGELAAVLERLLGGGNSGGAPDGDPLREAGTGGLGGGNAGRGGQPGAEGSAFGTQANRGGATSGLPAPLLGGLPGAGAGLGQAGGIGQGTPDQPQQQAGGSDRLPRVVADDGNNSVLVYGTPFQFREISTVLRQIDITPAQVLVQATVVEVTLNDALRYGVQFFLSNADSNFLLNTGTGQAPATQNQSTTTNALAGALSLVPQAPGFAYLLGYADRVRLLVEALSQVTQTRIVSAPRLVVTDRQLATIQVGDQVPIATQQLATQTTVAPTIVNSIQLRDTGVILRVRPRIGNAGLVSLEVEQEVSDVVQTTTSQLNSPTIRQRRARTIVSVQDGETVAVGGLIRDTATDTRTGIPVLNRLPYVGNLFGTTGGQRQRTELLILLTTTVIRDTATMREATAELQAQMRAIYQPARTGEPPARRPRLPSVAAPR